MKILNFKKFNLLEFHKMDNILPQNREYDLKIKDNDGTHFVRVKLTSYGWSLHREIIYYEFPDCFVSAWRNHHVSCLPS